MTPEKLWDDFNIIMNVICNQLDSQRIALDPTSPKIDVAMIAKELCEKLNVQKQEGGS